MKISVIGAGYVGLTTAACLAQIGHDVFCSESNSEKLKKLQNGVIPIFEPSLERIVESARSSGRLAFGSTEDAIDRSEAIFICVGTPPLPNGDADLSAIEAVARMIARRSIRISTSDREKHRACTNWFAAPEIPVGSADWEI